MNTPASGATLYWMGQMGLKITIGRTTLLVDYFASDLPGRRTPAPIPARYGRGLIRNMTFQEAADLAGELRPGLVIPGHWDMFADNPGDPEAFAAYLDVKYEGRIRCVIPEMMKNIGL